ncbi:MAG: hypothetical protein CMM92_01975 [Rickettsiales bacterium]|nr:hypothetical protein [Rickettsiales bacterium]RPG15362.1 MAG: M23 family metallopeptidase [Pelagibacteraceae bacterium TMED195]|tara:strand:+ start:2065 stop:2838 length:774 start_codon:yes stop_codon:yes gene_type:complete
MTNFRFLVLLLLFFFCNFSINYSNETEGSAESNNNVNENCENSLQWYEDHPGYKGEFKRVLKYCKNYAKDVSPEGFITNPIISDFGSFSGVNTRPRDTVHQGIDIIGPAEQNVIAVADGKVLEAIVDDCWGATLVVDHGKSLDNKKLITIYGHVGDFVVNENDSVKRGDVIAKLPEKVKHLCMARVRHLHLQIGQQYCGKEEKNNWGCKYFIKDFYNSLNPHLYWADGKNKVTCYEKDKKFEKGTLTYPFECKKKTN